MRTRTKTSVAMEIYGELTAIAACYAASASLLLYVATQVGSRIG